MLSDVPTLTGPRVRLRAFRIVDVDARLDLGRSPDIVRGFGGNPDRLPPLGRSEAQHWVERNMAHPLAWAVDVDCRLLGEIRLDGFNDLDFRARLAVGLYDESRLGQGFGREAIGLVLGYAFDVLELHRVDLRVIETNERAIQCYRACGFVEEGRERESARIGQCRYDDVIMGLLASDRI